MIYMVLFPDFVCPRLIQWHDEGKNDGLRCRSVKGRIDQSYLADVFDRAAANSRSRAKISDPNLTKVIALAGSAALQKPLLQSYFTFGSNSILSLGGRWTGEIVFFLLTSYQRDSAFDVRNHFYSALGGFLTTIKFCCFSNAPIIWTYNRLGAVWPVKGSQMSIKVA